MLLSLRHKQRRPGRLGSDPVSGRGSHRLLPQVCWSDRNDDLADLVVRFEEAVRVLDGVERDGARDLRL